MSYIVFIVIIISIINMLGKSAKKAQHARRGATPLPKEKYLAQDFEPLYEALPNDGFDEGEGGMSMRDQGTHVHEPDLFSPDVHEGPVIMASQYDPQPEPTGAPMIRNPQAAPAYGQLTASQMRNAVILSEILGPPRSRRRRSSR